MTSTRDINTVWRVTVGSRRRGRLPASGVRQRARLGAPDSACAGVQAVFSMRAGYVSAIDAAKRTMGIGWGQQW
jgi:hypothetical protein